MHPNVHWNTIYNSQDMEATSSVINRRMDKEDMSHIHTGILLLLLLSCISCVWLCATTKMASHQAPLSLGVSRQEHWSGPPFSSPSMKVKSESEIVQTCLTLSDLMDCSLPGSSVHGICQARVLEWSAIAFSETRSHMALLSYNNLRWVYLQRTDYRMKSKVQGK